MPSVRSTESQRALLKDIIELYELDGQSVVIHDHMPRVMREDLFELTMNRLVEPLSQVRTCNTGMSRVHYWTVSPTARGYRLAEHHGLVEKAVA